MPRHFLIPLLLFAIASAISYSQVSKLTPANNTGRSAYAGDAACAECHRELVESYHQTAHFFTSQLPDGKSMAGTFNLGANTLKTSNPNLSFRMDSNDKGFFETALWENPSHSRTEHIDIVIGSGGKGQTYLFWQDNALLQLPVSYSTILHQWVDSPGYRSGFANFDRPIIARCLECHATYFQALETLPSSNLYKQDNFVLGISCERCHGPGAEHVALYRTKPKTVQNSAIVNPAKLSRERDLDTCAQCHGGQGVRELKPAFSYAAGEYLSKYLDLGPVDLHAEIDVHGKQAMLLQKSRCYQASSMTCSTCHDVHRPERNLADFSARCLSCHKEEQCGKFQKLGHAIASNCIDCHMPHQASKSLVLDVNGKSIGAQVRTHWIKAYPANDQTTP